MVTWKGFVLVLVLVALAERANVKICELPQDQHSSAFSQGFVKLIW